MSLQKVTKNPLSAFDENRCFLNGIEAHIGIDILCSLNCIIV